MGRLLAWLRPRWGQMLCFWGAALMLIAPTPDADDARTYLPRAVAGGVLLFGGIGLKALAIWREKS